MNELPELPFKKVLSYLSLEDRLRSKAVSRRWYWMIDSFQVKALCYSERPAGLVEGKRRLISGLLAQNFICSARYDTFFNASRKSTFSNLKHLRLCDLDLNKNQGWTFVSVLQSFVQLEQLDIIRFRYIYSCPRKFKLNLPMLTGLWIDGALGFRHLTLDAPRLQKVRVCFQRNQTLELVHSESVEWLMVREWTAKAVKKMKNLKYLYLTGDPNQFPPSLLSSLPQLKEIHLHGEHELSRFFEQKQRDARTDLKIFYCGLLLTRPDDPAIRSLKPVLTRPDDGWWLTNDGYFSDKAVGCLAENSSRLADEIPFCKSLRYSVVEHVTPELQMSLLKKFINLRRINVHQPVEDTERFLVILKNLDTIERLEFRGDQPQELFDRLPEHCAVQRLTIEQHWDFDVRFLLRLEHLIELRVDFLIDAEFLRTILDELKFLSSFHFYYLDNMAEIRIEHPERFVVWVCGAGQKNVANLEAVIDFLNDPYTVSEDEEDDMGGSWYRGCYSSSDPAPDTADRYIDQFDSVLHVKRRL